MQGLLSCLGLLIMVDILHSIHNQHIAGRSFPDLILRTGNSWSLDQAA